MNPKGKALRQFNINPVLKKNYVAFQSTLAHCGSNLFHMIFQKDFFAVELINGNIFLHLNLGVDTIKIQASQSDKQIADGKWHKVGKTKYSIINVFLLNLVENNIKHTF